ncbi:unnamed protein product, partial [Rotaria socialis]
MDESIVNHLFLPCYLPLSEDHDYLIQYKHVNGYKLLEYMNGYFGSSESVYTTVSSKVLSHVFRIFIDCIKRWSTLQNQQSMLSASDLQTVIKQVPGGGFLPIYFHAQNAAILIQVDGNNANQALISSWQVLLPIKEVTSSLMPHFSCFPVTAHRLCNRSQLHSKVHCELLMDFMKNTIEYNGLPSSDYICQWWIQQFSEVKVENNYSYGIQFKKKHRDRVNCNSASVNAPFRRSGLWMTIKVVLQTIVTIHLKDIGTIVYKLLITHFLTYVIYTRSISTNSKLSIDLLVYCIRKIVRRLNKIDSLLSSRNSNDFNEWIIYVKQQIESRIKEITPKLDWQTTLRIHEKKESDLLMSDIKFDNLEIYKHSCEKLKTYLESNEDGSNKASIKLTSILNPSSVCLDTNNAPDYIPSCNDLTKQRGFTIAMAVTYMEIWVESSLEQWLDRSPSSINGTHNFEILLRFFEDYQTNALPHYYTENGPTDPIGYSKYIIASLTIIRSIHQKLCMSQGFERLRQHRIDIPNLIDLFQYLVLPSRKDMNQAHDLYKYFDEFNKKTYYDLLSNIESKDAFGVYFAGQSETMKTSLTKIKAQHEQDKRSKTEEVQKAIGEYESLIKELQRCPSQCFVNKPHSLCDKCKNNQQKANSIKVDACEYPLPSKREGELAVIFELQMPTEIRCYRDVIWQFVNRLQSKLPQSENFWMNTNPHGTKLQPFRTAPDKYKVKLVYNNRSSPNSLGFAGPSIKNTSIASFFCENTLQVQISSINSIAPDKECQILTPKLNHPDYKELQFTINSTKFVQNSVIAMLCTCPRDLKPTQFVEFGSFRSGHRLQWWNLLTIFEMDSLSITEESVAILIVHSILQNGPIEKGSDRLSADWCPETHRPLLNDGFVDALILKLDLYLDHCEFNWQDELVLVVITIVTMRVLSLCNKKKEIEVAKLALKCRKIGEKWIGLIYKNIQALTLSGLIEEMKLRDKMINIGVSCLLTFFIHSERIDYLLSSGEHIMSLLKAVSTIHDNIILNKNQLNMSVFMRNIKRLSERTLMIVQPIVAELLKGSSYNSLNDFTVIHWSVLTGKISKDENVPDMKWQKRSIDLYDGWYDGQYEGTEISIDCVSGSFLINKMTTSFLPAKILCDALFCRVFGNHNFEVQAAQSVGTYITKRPYHKERIEYEFCFNEHTKNLIINERHIGTDKVFQLIPHTYFQNELPDIFVSHHSHWLNAKEKIIQFRPIHFQDVKFLDNISYELSIETGYVTTTGSTNTQVLVNQSSTLFNDLFSRYFTRLDNKPYVYMVRDNLLQMIQSHKSPHDDTTIHIHLSRLGIAFKYSTSSRHIVSREYSDMYIDEDQWFGTLTGLQSGLILSSFTTNNEIPKHYLCRKLIIPFGQIHAQKPSNNHQMVTIDRAPPFLHQYFVFIVNDRLKILQPTISPSGWLYLALLHAMTSNTLPDEYTGVTGMERSFQLLNSAGCSSDQPFDLLSLNILRQIASISPRSQCSAASYILMQDIQWNPNLPYFIQHFGYYFIAKQLFDTSMQLSFMYTSSISKEASTLFEGKCHNESLLSQLYWNYRDSYTPMARLSEEIEEDILSSKPNNVYQPTSVSSSFSKNYSSISIVDMYQYGDVNVKGTSEVKWLPLSQWLTPSYHLKNVWIGLLKLADALNIAKSANLRIEETQQFEILLNFLHYIHKKVPTNAFYLQILKTVLKVGVASLRNIEFPPDGVYNNINEIAFVESRICWPYSFAHEKKSQIIVEIQNCCVKERAYENNTGLLNAAEISGINKLLTSWKLNKKLRCFLDSVQRCIYSLNIEQLNTILIYPPQRFAIESIKDHYKIHLKLMDKAIDERLLSSAKNKFLDLGPDYFNRPRISVRDTNYQKEIPGCIFASIEDSKDSSSKDSNDSSSDDSEDSSSEDSEDSSIRDSKYPFYKIRNYFKDRLQDSWKKLELTEEYRVENPSVTEIIDLLNSLRMESAQYWNELVKSIRSCNEMLFETGALLRITPTVLICLFQQIWLDERQHKPGESHSAHSQEIVKTQKHVPFSLNVEQRNVLGGIIVNWTIEQQMERALRFALQNKQYDLEKEILNIPHADWKPVEYLPWLILELETNITIRKIQFKVARHMMTSSTNQDNDGVRNIVTQLNMGEGKTSVILPMLTLSLCLPGTSLVRVVVLKHLSVMNYESLKLKLGGLLGRRVFPFVCRRDMNIDKERVDQIFNRYKQAVQNCDIILTSPEDILSFDLLAIDNCRRKSFDIGGSMLTVQRWLKTFTSDILDESDEILSVKYQLVYTVGSQQQVDAGMSRWKTIQSVLALVKELANNIAKKYADEVCYQPLGKSHFPQFRLLSKEPFKDLCEKITKGWLKLKQYPKSTKVSIEEFFLHPTANTESLDHKISPDEIQVLLILRGLLVFDVLFIALTKRYRVNYGVNTNSNFKRLMAVPFRAKDVAAEKTEFGHPDLAILLTQLSYYYSGLNESQMTQCFDHLNKQRESDPEVIYGKWIGYQTEDKDKDKVHPSIKEWKGVNLNDYQQKTDHLFPTFRKNMLVIDYFLDHFVFPREAKQFPHKLISSSWDLSSPAPSKMITGFSGTSDTQLLLPCHIKQCDLPELQQTDAIVINNLLKSGNDYYKCLPKNATSENILKEIVGYEFSIRVILDVGALLIDGTNREISMKWLAMSDQAEIDYVVYFESDSIVVCDRDLRYCSFQTSPASQRLDHCLFYLDQVHTRGTDFKFPDGFKAAVTLGSDLTKDRLVQACMRMRKLGKDHFVTFWSSHEVDQQITLLKSNVKKTQKKNTNNRAVIH